MTETQHIEWKSSWRDEYLKWLCGFANADGGTLVIGKNDRGEVVGVPNAQKLLVDIPNKARDVLGIIVDVNLRKENRLDYLEIRVEPYPYPVSYKGEYHYRSGSTKQELKGAALDRFLLRKQGLHWDGVPVPYVTLADLDDRPLTYFRKRAERSGRLSSEILQETDADLIDKLHLMNGTYLKRAAVLLFHPGERDYGSSANQVSESTNLLRGYTAGGDLPGAGRGTARSGDQCHCSQRLRQCDPYPDQRL
jgi:ATP-dependent DNA helicase RecG